MPYCPQVRAGLSMTYIISVYVTLEAGGSEFFVLEKVPIVFLQGGGVSYCVDGQVFV